MVVIKKATPENASLLSIIAISSKGHWGYTKEVLASWIPKLMVSEEALEKHYAYKLVKKNEVLGFYLLKKDVNEVINLEFLFVLPAYIGQGYGGQLLNHAIQKAKELSTQSIKVLSDPNAEAFYESYGFKKIGEKESSIPERFLPIMQLDV